MNDNAFYFIYLFAIYIISIFSIQFFYLKYKKNQKNYPKNFRFLVLIVIGTLIADLIILNVMGYPYYQSTFTYGSVSTSFLFEITLAELIIFLVLMLYYIDLTKGAQSR